MQFHNPNDTIHVPPQDILVLSRQNLPVLEGTLEHASDSVQKGAYVLSPQKGEQPEGF